MTAPSLSRILFLYMKCRGRYHCTTNSSVKSTYDNAHNLAAEKLLKPTDIDKRLFLPALFDIPKSIDRRYLASLNNLPERTIRSISVMEKAINNNTVIDTSGITLNTVDEMAFQHILVRMYLNHSKPFKRRSSEIDFIVKSVSGLFCSLWSPHDEITVSWYVEHKLVRLGVYKCILTISFIYLGTLLPGQINKICLILFLHDQTLYFIQSLTK